MAWQKPDYRRCSLNLISSIANHLGVPLSSPTLPYLDEMLKKKHYQNIIVMLFDGLGMNLMEEALPEDAFLRKNTHHHLSAVFPSTTTNATSTIECGLCPREHGWLGWTLFFPQLNQPVDLFTNRSQGKIASDFHVANRYIPREMIFPKITAAGKAQASCISRFGDTQINRLDGLFDLALAQAQDQQRRYIYTYWDEPDHTMHDKGCHHPKIFDKVKDINARVEALYHQLPENSLLMLTADHGLCDGQFIYLEDYPHLLSMLRHPPTMESRAASLHVKSEYLSIFPQAFHAALGDHFLLIDRERFIEEYLGEGPVRPEVFDFVGDYCALSIDNYCLDVHPDPHPLKGVHGGLTKQEMIVPLMITEK